MLMARISVFAQYLLTKPRIYVRTVDVVHPRAQILFLHASAVHSDYYLPLAINLAEAGIRVWIPDLRGHGRSEGTRGHIINFQEYLTDLTAIWELFCSPSTSPLPTLRGGETLGGLAALLAAQGPVHPDGLFFISPALQLRFRFHPYIFRLLWSIRPAVGRLRPLFPLPMQGVTVDPNVVDLIQSDPLANRYYTLGFLLNLIRAQDTLIHPEDIQCPSLSLFSQEDPIVDAPRAAQLLARAPMNQSVFLDKALHSLVADSPDRILSLFLEWYTNQFDQNPSSRSWL
jgi:alpha-beta hydrolase superfamily lysophospholipase